MSPGCSSAPAPSAGASPLRRAWPRNHDNDNTTIILAAAGKSAHQHCGVFYTSYAQCHRPVHCSRRRCSTAIAAGGGTNERTCASPPAVERQVGSGPVLAAALWCGCPGPRRRQAGAGACWGGAARYLTISAPRQRAPRSVPGVSPPPPRTERCFSASHPAWWHCLAPTLSQWPEADVRGPSSLAHATMSSCPGCP